MSLKIKPVSILITSVLTVLILFAGCGKDGGGAGQVSQAELVAGTVNCFATTNKIQTAGNADLTFTAEITVDGEGSDAAWCSFNLSNSQALTGAVLTGKVGEPVYLDMQPNTTSADRTVTIAITYSDGYTVSLPLTQTAYQADVDYTQGWGEQPAYQANSAYIYKTYYTTLTSGYTRNYSICYDTEKRVSRWVAYPMIRTYTTPGLGRPDPEPWGYDPNDQQPAIPTSAQLSGYFKGYNRGHMIASADRYSTKQTNAMTYYSTNMMPQVGQFNSPIWSELENDIRTNMNSMRLDTLYVVTGTVFGDGRTTTDSDGKVFAVPSQCWKILLRTRSGATGKRLQDCTADELIGIGFLYDNKAGNSDVIAEHTVPIDSIEKLTGFTFFRNLPPDAAASVKAQNNLADPGWQGLK